MISLDDDDKVKMTFDNYKAIFGMYFASLGVPLTVYLLEIMQTLGRFWKKCSFQSFRFRR